MESFKNVKVQTFLDNKENNNLEINFDKKIRIKGKSFDSSNLIKQLSDGNKTKPSIKLVRKFQLVLMI